MNIWLVPALLLTILLYIIYVIKFLKEREKTKDIEFLLNEQVLTPMKTFAFEDAILKKFKIEPDKVRFVLYIERVLIFTTLAISVYFFKGLAVAGFLAILIVFFSEDAYKKVIYESGITNINKVMNFINFFVPHINSGHSANQSLLGYIEYSLDTELSEYYENKDNQDYIIPTHLRQIVDIYDIARYNEEKGISDYTYILNELSKDMAQKQIYYNSFISRIGEIQPIMWSYYIGVPILIGISLGQTYDFWMGIGGYVVAFILLILFGLFKFLIFKLQKKTINVIF